MITLPLTQSFNANLSGVKPERIYTAILLTVLAGDNKP